MSLKYKKVLLKVSGEALMGDQGYGIDTGTLDRICHDIKQGIDLGVRVALVVGGGNLDGTVGRHLSRWRVRRAESVRFWRNRRQKSSRGGFGGLIQRKSARNGACFGLPWGQRECRAAHALLQ